MTLARDLRRSVEIGRKIHALQMACQDVASLWPGQVPEGKWITEVCKLWGATKRGGPLERELVEALRRKQA